MHRERLAETVASPTRARKPARQSEAKRSSVIKDEPAVLTTATRPNAAPRGRTAQHKAPNTSPLLPKRAKVEKQAARQSKETQRRTKAEADVPAEAAASTATAATAAAAAAGAAAVKPNAAQPPRQRRQRARQARSRQKQQQQQQQQQQPKQEKPKQEKQGRQPQPVDLDQATRVEHDELQAAVLGKEQMLPAKMVELQSKQAVADCRGTLEHLTYEETHTAVLRTAALQATTRAAVLEVQALTRRRDALLASIQNTTAEIKGMCATQPDLFDAAALVRGAMERGTTAAVSQQTQHPQRQPQQPQRRGSASRAVGARGSGEQQKRRGRGRPPRRSTRSTSTSSTSSASSATIATDTATASTATPTATATSRVAVKANAVATPSSVMGTGADGVAWSNQQQGDDGIAESTRQFALAVRFQPVACLQTRPFVCLLFLCVCVCVCMCVCVCVSVCLCVCV